MLGKTDVAIVPLFEHHRRMEWGLIAIDFERCDGALCDIHVHNTTVHDWQTVIDKLRRVQHPLELRIGGEAAELPNDISELLFRHPDASCPTMYVRMGSTTLNCHFYTDEEIEFDLNPRDMKQELLPSLLSFLKLLGTATNKPVILAVENLPDATIMRFNPAAAVVEYVGPAFG